MTARARSKAPAPPTPEPYAPEGRYLATPLAAYAIDVHTVSLANLAGHEDRWKTARRAKEQRDIARLITIAHRDELRGIELPLTIVLVRVAPRALDDGNLGAAFKAVQDGITDGLERVMPKGAGPRSDRDRLRWQYGQRRPSVGESPGVEVRLHRPHDAARALLRLCESDSEIARVIARCAEDLDALLVREVAR